MTSLAPDDNSKYSKMRTLFFKSYYKSFQGIQRESKSVKKRGGAPGASMGNPARGKSHEEGA